MILVYWIGERIPTGVLVEIADDDAAVVLRLLPPTMPPVSPPHRPGKSSTTSGSRSSHRASIGSSIPSAIARSSAVGLRR